MNVAKPWAAVILKLRLTASLPSGLHRRNPHFFRCRSSDRDFAGSGDQTERLVVVAFQDAHLGAGSDATLVEKAQERTVALIDASHLIVLAWESLGEQAQASPTAGISTLRHNWVAMWACARRTQLLCEFAFEFRRNGVF